MWITEPEGGVGCHWQTTYQANVKLNSFLQLAKKQMPLGNTQIYKPKYTKGNLTKVKMLAIKKC